MAATATLMDEILLPRFPGEGDALKEKRVSAAAAFRLSLPV